MMGTIRFLYFGFLISEVKSLGGKIKIKIKIKIKNDLKKSFSQKSV